jgi:hypothetical protein
MRVSRKNALVAAGLVGVGLLAIPVAAFAAPGSPKMVTVNRSAADPHRIAVSWKPVDGSSRYNVSVFDGTTDEVRMVATSAAPVLNLTRSEPCVRLRVNVGSRNAIGLGGTSGNVWLNSLAPGGISGLTVQRSTDGAQATATWKAPTWPGFGQPGGYRIQLIRLTDKVVLQEKVVAEPTATLTGVDPALDYTLAVTPENAFGSCSTAKVTLGAPEPGAVGGIKVARDPKSPTTVNLAWTTPAYAGWAPVAHYMVGYGIGRTTTWTRADATTATLQLDPTSQFQIQIKAVNEFGEGKISGVVKVPTAGAAPTVPAGTKPDITLTQDGSDITVSLSTKIGSYKLYPKLLVRLRPVMDPTGHHEEQVGQDGASALVFRGVPNGLYTVEISGLNTAGAQLWKTETINIGRVGAVTSTGWQTLYGRPGLSGTTVTAPADSEVRLLTKATRTSADMVLSSTVQLKSGRRYGMWVRAGQMNNGKVSALQVEFDPGYSKTVSNYGPALVLRSHHANASCAQPLAVAKLPAALAAAGPHQVMVVAKGDTLTASVDGVAVLTVPNLSTVNAASPCKFPLAAGTKAGLRTMSGDNASVVFTGTTLN